MMSGLQPLVSDLHGGDASCEQRLGRTKWGRTYLAPKQTFKKTLRFYIYFYIFRSTLWSQMGPRVQVTDIVTVAPSHRSAQCPIVSDRIISRRCRRGLSGQNKRRNPKGKPTTGGGLLLAIHGYTTFKKVAKILR